MTLRHADDTTTVTDLDEALDWLGDTPQDFLDALPDAQALPIRHAYNTHRLENDAELLSPDVSPPSLIVEAVDDPVNLNYVGRRLAGLLSASDDLAE